MIDRRDRGAALPLALLALLVMGALGTAVWVQAVDDQRLTRASVRLEQAFAAGEAGLASAVASGSGADTSLSVGAARSFSGRLTGGGGWFRGTVVRLNTRLVLVRVEGFSPDSQARQHVGLLLTRDPDAPGGMRPVVSRAFVNLY